MDIVMPNMSGVEAVKRIKEYAPNTFVVMMTGEATEDEKKQSLEYGGYVVLRKPFKLETFLHQVHWFQQVKEMQEQERKEKEHWKSLSPLKKLKIRLKKRVTLERVRLYIVIGVLSVVSFFIVLGIINIIFHTQVTIQNMYQTIVGYLQRDEQREIQMMNRNP